MSAGGGGAAAAAGARSCPVPRHQMLKTPVCRCMWYYVQVAVFVAVLVYVDAGPVHRSGGEGGTPWPTAVQITKPTPESRPDDLAAAAKHLNFPGYHPPRACKLDGAEFANASFVFAALVKHGVHSQSWLHNNGRCRKDRLAFVPALSTGKSSVPAFVRHPHTHKVLPVRGQLSFFKSVYNHVCNKKLKAGLRAKNGINCSKQNEFAHLQSIEFQEMSSNRDPNRIRDLVVQAGPKHLLFYDYAALGNLTAPFCENGLENMTGEEMNSASDQEYVDHWGAQNVSTWRAGLSKFWDDMSMQLKRYQCLHFEKKGAGKKNR